ncbi:MAG: transposase [Peptostreptococcaceae bacterium]|nr:transposase [Peptostreptococcaceae bacterium]
MESKKRFYSTVFKDKAVSLSYQRDNLKELADELGINVQRLYKWRTSMKSTPSNRATSSTKASFNGDEEIKRLKKELKDAQLELEILKKAVNIFSRSDGRSISL